MAYKFEKEEKFNYDSNTDSDGETNNSKSRSGSSSPTAEFEHQVYNDTSGRRSGGPNAVNIIRCYIEQCQSTCNLTMVVFTCGHYIFLCGVCIDSNYFNCPIDRQCSRKYLK